MRKLFSLMLIAVGLLISGNAKAAVIEVNGSTETLKQAFDRAVTGDSIKLTASLNEMGGICRLYDGRDITLNLNGNNINVPNDDIFMIYKGHLTITGKGTITFSSSIYGGAKNPHTIDGVTYSGGIPYMFITLYGHNDPSTPVGYSWFTLGKDVTLKCSGKSSLDYQYGISVSMFGNWPNDYRDALNDELGYTSPSTAYGVRVDVSGKIYATGLCLGTNGTIQATTGNVPEIYIYETAELVCENPDDPENAGIYAAGYAKWYLNGCYLSGGIGLAVKSGEIHVDGATIEANENAYKVPSVNGNGTSGYGSAIVFDSNYAYAGKMTIEIKGNTTVYSPAGYAIEDVLTNADESLLDKVEIESGTFVGNHPDGQGGLECMKITEGVVQKGGVEITGGTYSEEDVKSLLGSDGVVTPVMKDGEWVYVIAEKPTEAGDWITDINSATASSFVKYADGTADITLTNAKTECAYLTITAARKLVIGANQTLSAGEIVLGDEAQIEVAPTGKLIVNGVNGLVAFETSNLVLKANADAVATFLLNPAVKANKTPWATVEYMCSPLAGKLTIADKTAYYWDIISSPFAEMISITTPDQSSYYQRVVDQAYVNVTDKQQIYDNVKAFDALAICPNADRGSIKYIMTGKLQGATSLADYAVVSGFNHMGNAYMAKMNAKELVTELQQNNGSIRTLIYIWSVESQKYIGYNGYLLQQLGNIDPMKSAFLYSDGEGTANLNYEKLIWNVNK